MLVECVNRYLNKGPKVMANERGLVRIIMEAILLLLYVWNGAPIPGTDHSRCFVALGCEFQFPIYFLGDKHWELTSTPATVKSYSKSLAVNLQALHEISKILVEEQRAWHREFINARWPDPKVYSVDDIVFARRAVRSDAIRGCINKLSYPFTGPWQNIAGLPGTSYDIKHCSMKKGEKRHASDLSPYPAELLPLHLLDGANNQYSQINKKILDNPYIQAGIKGFTPPTPFRVPSNFLSADTGLRFHWPTLTELNKDLFLCHWDFDTNLPEHQDDNEAIPSPGFYTGPPPSTLTYSAPDIPPINVLAQRIITSQDRLFFISHAIGSGDVREWHLVRVAFEATMSLYLPCLVDGCYLVDFCLPHPSDSWYNAINKRFWLQYHNRKDIIGPMSLAHTHYIRSSDTSKAYTNRHRLLPYQKYLNLTHTNMFIHGPFDFAVIHGQKRHNSITQSAWDKLKSHSDMFHNQIPRFDVPTYSIHVDCGAHISCFCAIRANELIQSAKHAVQSPGQCLYP
jgi:hypothetical protein